MEITSLRVKSLVKAYQFTQYWDTSLSEMPDCCGMGIVHGFDEELDEEMEDERKKDVRNAVRAMLRLADLAAYINDLTALIASASDRQTVFINGLRWSGYRAKGKFINRNTDNEVGLYYKVVKEDPAWPEYGLYDPIKTTLNEYFEEVINK